VKRSFLCGCIALAATACTGYGAGAHDTYANYADLASHEQEGHDYTITVTDRGSPFSVLAIHGGYIDTGTERIAMAVAGSDWNSYVFVGPSFRYHVTSAHFDEPRAVAMARRSDVCVTIHGHRSPTPRICVGGANEALRAEVAGSLTRSGLPFQILTHCPGLDGKAPTNPANLCRRGVQLELSGGARDELFADPELMASTAQAVRTAMGALR
jgi:phage replication-related protein YjqB (UPF0714/DUF867 family)